VAYGVSLVRELRSAREIGKRKGIGLSALASADAPFSWLAADRCYAIIGKRVCVRGLASAVFARSGALAKKRPMAGSLSETIVRKQDAGTTNADSSFQ